MENFGGIILFLEEAWADGTAAMHLLNYRGILEFKIA